MPHVSVLWLRQLRFLLETVSCDWCDGIKHVGQYTRLSIGEAILVMLLKNTHLKHEERKLHVSLHVLLFAFGSECSREQKFQGTKVPGSKSTRERKFHLWYVGTKVPVTSYTPLNLCRNSPTRPTRFRRLWLIYSPACSTCLFSWYGLLITVGGVSGDSGDFSQTLKNWCIAGNWPFRLPGTRL